MKWQKWLSALLLSLAFIATMSVIIPSGSNYCYQGSCGIFFWGAHEHDSVWHLAVANTLLKHWPFQMPNMSSVPITGYNYLMDVLIAIMSKITGISFSILYFKILPISWFLLISYFSYQYSLSYRKTKTFPIFMWLFLFFGSSFSYLLRLRNLGTIWGSSSILSMQPLQNMLNPQYAWSLIPLLFLLTGINREKRKLSDYLAYGFMTMIALGLKFYTGSAMLLIIGVDLLAQLIAKKDQLKAIISKGLIVAILSFISIWIFYSPGKSTGFPFSLKPLATVNPIIEDASLFYLPGWASRLYDYNGVRLVGLEIVVLGVFVIFNFGTRAIAMLFSFTKEKLTDNYGKKTLIIAATATLFCAILLVQKGVWWNTVQFLYVSLFLFGILAAEGLDILWNSKQRLAKLLVAGIIILMIPSNLDVMRTFMHFPGSGYLSQSELSALAVLKEAPSGVVLAPYFGKRPESNGLSELSRKYDTAYISAYTGKQTYLSDLIQLQLTNIPYQARLEKMLSFDCAVLDEVAYVYEYRDTPFANQYAKCGRSIQVLDQNDSVTIYLVR